MTTTAVQATHEALVDHHSVLLWELCGRADELIDAARSRQRVTPAFDLMVGFLHERLLPSLSAEERDLPAAGLRDEHLTRLLLTDHERLRADVENLELSRTRRLLTLATDVLVERLDRHVFREESWLTDPTVGLSRSSLLRSSPRRWEPRTPSR